MKLPYLHKLTATAGIALILLSACNMDCEKGSGHEAKVTRKVGAFTKIDVSGGFKLTLKQDSSSNITVSADDNLLELIKTEIHGDELRISTGKKNICSELPMEITIGVKDLKAIDASGAVEIKTDGLLVAKDIKFDLSGSTKLNMDMNAGNVQTQGSGATEINLRGQASSHSIDLSGAGKVYALDFVVGNYNISTTGATECNINVLHELNVESTGASSIKYRGNPDNVNNHKTGASSITKIN